MSLKYEKFGGCYGTVTGRCRSGVFLKLDNVEEAFVYKFTSLLPGAEVVCTVLKLPTDERRMLALIDSVCSYISLAA